jgi:hypothetical protein
MTINTPPIRYRRRITGMSAILLPLLSESEIDSIGFRKHVARTADAGLVPAVNMDTGYGNLITANQRMEVLQGGVTLSSGELQPIEPILVGRNVTKLQRLAEMFAKSKIGHSIQWSTNVKEELAYPQVKEAWRSRILWQDPQRSCRIRVLGFY